MGFFFLPASVTAFFLLVGCSTALPVPCPPPAGQSESELEDNYSKNRAAASQTPAESRSPDDKGPSPEGVEAIALLGSQVLDAQRETCEKPKSRAPSGDSL